MRKFVTRNRIALFSAILLVAFLSLAIFKKSFSNKVDNIEHSDYSSVSQDRKNMWNKMMVSNVAFSYRITGKTENLDRSGTSNMNGVDVSLNDEYLKVGDYLIYNIELNINPNTSEEGVFDNTEFYGGVIKFRATLPDYVDKEYLVWQKESWMSEYSISSDMRTITGYYLAPSDVNLMGSIQELSFTLRANWFPAEIIDNIEFEFWMEGNNPDNEPGHISDAESKSIIVSEPLKITAKDPNLKFSFVDGRVKRIGYKNGVLGQYVNFGIEYSFNSYTPIGYNHPIFDSLKTRIKLSLYSRDLNTGEGWTLVNSSDSVYSNMIDRTEVVATNRNCDFNNQAWPYNDSNYLYAMCGFSQTSSGNVYNYNGRDYAYDSGVVSASYRDGYVYIVNDSIDSSHMQYDIYSGGRVLTHNYEKKQALGENTTWYGVSNMYLMDAIELFIPYDLSRGDNIDYKIVLQTVDISGFDKVDNDIFTTSRTDTLEVVYSEQNTGNLSGNILYADTNNYYNERYIYHGTTSRILSTFSISKDGYYGEERLINVDANLLRIVDNIEVQNQHDLDFHYFYGIYKNNPIKGLNGIEEVNSKDVEDFYWYDSYSDASSCYNLKSRGEVSSSSSCVVTSIYIKDLDYTGKDNAPNFIFNVRTRNDLYDDYVDGKKYTGYIRQKALIYTESTRDKNFALKYYYDNSPSSYTPATFDEHLSVSSHASPGDAGISFVIAYDSPSLTGEFFDTYGNKTTNFNVMDGMVYYSITGNLYGNVDAGIRDDMSIYVIVPDSLTLKESTANILPSEKYIYSGKNYYVWNFKNCKLRESVPSSCDGYDDTVSGLYFGLEMSPIIPNNSKLNISLKGSTGLGERTVADNVGTTYLYVKGSYNAPTIMIANLSGTYARNMKSSDVVSVNEGFTITNNVYNNSSNDLRDVKTVQVLPYDNDEYGSKFSGDYEIKVKSLKNNLRLYYSNYAVSESGVTSDSEGKLTVSSVDLESDSRWIRVNVGDTIPSSAKLIASYINSVSTTDSLEYSYEIIPSSNKSGDVYGIKTYSSSSSLSSNLSTNVISVKVFDKKITGFVFLDKNGNNIYDDADIYLKDQVVDLYNEDNELVGSATTDSLGRYVIGGLKRGNYYVKHRTDSNYDYVLKNAGSDDVSSVVDTNGKSDLITKLQVINLDSDTIVDNINIGMSLKQGTLTINHYLKDSSTMLAPSEVSSLYCGDAYNSSPVSALLVNYDVEIPSNASGTVSENTVVNYYYVLKNATITVNHYVEGTTTKLADTEVRTVRYTDSYTTSPSSEVSSNYELVTTPSNASGVVSGDVVVNYYYKLKESTLVIKYLDKDSDRALSSEVSKIVYYGNTYEAEDASDIPNNYEFYSKTSNYTGIVDSNRIEVIFYYQKKDSSLETTINKSGPEKVTSVRESIQYTITYNATVRDYIGSATIEIVDTLPYEIDTQKSELDGGNYDSVNKTITWAVEWNDVDSYSDKGNKTVTKNLTIVFKGIDPKTRIMVSSVRGNIELDNNSRSVESQLSTGIQVMGTITVHHYSKGTTVKLKDDETSSGLVGELYECKAISSEGYKVVKEPNDKVIEYIDGNVEVVFEYEKNKFSIKTKVLNEGGAISGDEYVSYGDDSTDGLIVISPQEGYVVSRIVINGEEIDSSFCLGGCVLDKFVNVTSDRTVEVQFAPGVSNPDTATLLKKTFLIVLIIGCIVIRMLMVKFKPKFINIK